MRPLLIALIALTAMTAQAQYGAAPAAPAEKKLTTISVNDEGEKLLADTRGNTLYVFDVDLKQKTSMCNADCAEMWPAYLLTTEEMAQVKAPFGVIIRANKKVQLTYEGRPVYTYAFDRGAAADAGEGVGGVWHYIEIED